MEKIYPTSNTWIKKYSIVWVVFIFCGFYSFAQCPQLIDGAGNSSSTPYWISCNGNNYTVFIQSNNNIGAYTIDFGDGTPVVAGGSLPTGNFVSHTYTITVDTFIVVFTETSSGCIIQGVVVMEVTPSASIQIPLGSPIFGCTPATFQFKNSTTNVSNTTRFTWNFGDGSPTLNFDYTNGGVTINHTYLPGTTNCNVAVTLTAENYCNTGNPSINTYQPVQVWDLDNANITPSATLLCFPDNTVHFDNTTNLNCYALGNTSQRYEYWNFGNYWGTGDSIIDWQPFNPPVRPGYTIAYPGIGTYDVMLIDSSYCGKDTAYITINIVAPPVAGLSSDKDSVCQGQNIIFSNSTTGGANSFTWNFGDGNILNTSSTGNITHTYNSVGTVTVTLSATIAGGSASCVSQAQKVIIVKPSPQSIFTNSNPTNCDTGYVNFTDASISATAWKWKFGNGNTSIIQSPPQQFYNAPGNYVVTLTVTSANGCINSSTDTIKIYQSPTAAFSTSNACVNTLATFINQSTFPAGDTIISWTWNFGDGPATATGTSASHTYTVASTYSVILTVGTTHCADKDTVSININVLPTAQFTKNTSAGCTPLPITFTNTSTGGINFSWNFGDGSAQTATNSPSHVFTNASSNDTTYIIRLIAENIFGCRDTIDQTVTVYHAAKAAFAFNATPGCSPLPITFTNTSTGAVNYSWNFGDGSPLTNSVSPTHTFINNSPFLKNFTITLNVTSSNGCTDSSKKSITVFPEPNISISSLPNDTGCSPLGINFSASSGGVIYEWDFDDGGISPFQNPAHTFSNTGIIDSTYAVSLIVTSPFSCKDTSYIDIVVHPRPVANYSTNVTGGCQPLTVNFQNISTGGTIYVWDFGDISPSSSSNNPSHVYSNTTSASIFYQPRLIVTSAFGCTDTVKKIVEVYPVVIAAFAADTEGCSPFNPNIINQSTGAVSFNWDFGDGTSSTSPTPIHTYLNNSNNDTTFILRLIATSGYNCSDTIFQNIIIHPSPFAGFTALPGSQVYPNATVAITNTTNNGNWQYEWNFGDGSNSTQQNPPPHTYATWGTYFIKLKVSSTYCSDSITQQVIIIPPVPIAGWTLSDTIGCTPLTINFNDASTYATNYAWSFGDGAISNQQNPNHTYYYPGTYTATLIVTGPGGMDTIITSIIVNPKPFAFFTVNPSLVNIPTDPVYCYNLSSDADTYLWDFGDGTTSTEVSPQHYYTVAESYFIMLYAMNNFGCRDTFVLPSEVKAQESGEIVLPTAFTPNPSGPNGGVYDPQEFSNDVFYPFTSGVTEFQLLIYNRWGELLFESKELKTGWDGYYKGKLCQQDVYVWKVVAKYVNGNKVVKTGNVTLLR